MKTLSYPFLLALALTAPAAVAGGGVGQAVGSTESTQMLNNVLLADGYAQQVLQYQNQLLQYETMLKNLAAHPLGNISPTLGTIVAGQARVIAGSRDIGNTMARVDQDFATYFKSPTAALYADRFKGLTDHSDSALKASMLNSGLQRENFATDEAAIAALVNKNHASDGNLGAIKTLGEINSAQLQESMKLRDLISQQQIAENTYLATQNGKDQVKEDANKKIMYIAPRTLPSPPARPTH